jgi:hypothetical protein
MAATVVVSESNGAGATVTDNISNINFGSDDAPNLVAAASPIIIGQKSFWKNLRCKMTALGGSSALDNFLIYKTSGTYVTGESIKCSCDRDAGTGFGRWFRISYQTPAETAFPTIQLDIGTVLPTTPNIGIDANGTADDLNSDTVSGSLTVVDTYTQYWYLQLYTTGSTPAGAVNQKTFTIQYDET